MKLYRVLLSIALLGISPQAIAEAGQGEPTEDEDGANGESPPEDEVLTRKDMPLVKPVVSGMAEPVIREAKNRSSPLKRGVGGFPNVQTSSFVFTGLFRTHWSKTPRPPFQGGSLSELIFHFRYMPR